MVTCVGQTRDVYSNVSIYTSLVRLAGYLVPLRNEIVTNYSQVKGKSCYSSVTF